MKGNLSGQASHQKMMVQPRYISPDNKTPIPAAVLVLLYPDKKQWHFFLTKHTKTVEHHKGQISLPGGMLEEGESNKEAAIRETYEEMGIESKRINIIGSLTPLHIPVSGFKIFPFVGWIKEKPKLKKPRMYKVIILNDDYTPMRFVTAILMEYFSKSKVEADAIMLEIHKKGKGIAGIYPFDIAETKLRQIIKHARKEEYPLQAKLESE